MLVLINSVAIYEAKDICILDETRLKSIDGMGKNALPLDELRNVPYYKTH
jgi:hypothetical protein